MFKTPEVKVPAAPQIDNATDRRNQRDMGQRRATTILTSESGLPNLGSVARPQAS